MKQRRHHETTIVVRLKLCRAGTIHVVANHSHAEPPPRDTPAENTSNTVPATNYTASPCVTHQQAIITMNPCTSSALEKTITVHATTILHAGQPFFSSRCHHTTALETSSHTSA